MTKTRILVVDDDSEIRQVIKIGLKPLDVVTLTADNGFHALDVLSSHGVDILLADQRMPGMSGLTLLQEVKKRYPHITRLLITGHLEVDIFKEAINVGEIYKIITKPFKVQELRRTIEETVDFHISKTINKEFIDKLEQEVKLFFHSFFNSGDAIVITDRQARIKYVNQAFLKLYGYSLNEVIGENPWDFLLSQSDPQLFKKIWKAIRDPASGSWKGEMVNRRKNGTTIPVLGSVIPLRDHKGKITNFLGMAYNMTPQKKLENRLRKSERKYRQIIQNAAEAIFQTDFNGEFRMVNPAFITLFDCTSKSRFIREHTLADIFSSAADVEALFQTLSRQPSLENVEYRMRRVSGGEFTSVLNAQVVPGKDGKPKYLQGFIRDITAEKQMQELRNRMQRMEALGQLSAGLAHEIRNPVASIKLNLQFLQRKYEADQFFQENIAEVFEGLLRVEKIMDQTLFFAGKKRPVLIAEAVYPLLKRSVELIKVESPTPGIDFVIDCPPGFPRIHLDKQQFLQIMVNLIKNGLQAMPDGGKITITCREKTVDRQPKAVIDIADSGKGIPEDMREKIFNPFYTTKSSGIGLGLSIVHKILDQHNATIEVASSAGKGATFSLVFPCEKDKN